ncbi:MAG: Crp/Fnr family transcriptional regulator [Polyangiales bacterium]
MRKGESLWRVGELASSFTFVTAGLVGVSVPVGARGEMLLGIAAPGDSLGEAAALVGSPRADHAYAFSSATAVARLPREVVNELCAARASLALQYAQHISRRHRTADRRLVSLTLPSETRIAEIVLALAARFGRPLDDGSTVIPHRITRANLASMVGTTVETTIRTLSRWSREGVLSPTAGAMVITDLPALCRVARIPAESLSSLDELTRLV